MSSYTFPKKALPLLTNPSLRTDEELELENFLTSSTVGGNTYRIIRTNFIINDEISLRVRQGNLRDAQAKLLISKVYGNDFNIEDVDIREFKGLTQRQLLCIQTYLQENR